jgi:hypothetical protein
MSCACRIGCRCILNSVSLNFRWEARSHREGKGSLLSSASSRGKNSSSSASLSADMTSCGDIVFLLLRRAFSFELCGRLVSNEQ